jgi:hypothetical protein
MIRAVKHLQALASASQLYAFTSLWRFYVTTSPAYKDAKGHFSVSIVWRWPDRRFRLSFGDLGHGWVNDWEPHQLCDEAAFPLAVEPFVNRLLATRSASSSR